MKSNSAPFYALLQHSELSECFFIDKFPTKQGTNWGRKGGTIYV
ncbi:hypothetical protein SRCM101294_02956 [Bacillus amyloliquefaciens]|nr:hypothetical protein [Bacillus amyloliquefaciens]OCB93592.1 hypothetical protein SRCM101294_02956 [Bacillus amyloliquefaciens]